jgi:vacuolar-type H+-ATPase subunit H
VDEDSGVKPVASTATERTREVAHDASAHAGELAESVREHAGEVGQEVIQQGRRVVEDARDTMREQTDVQSRQAVSALRQWSERGRALADGRPQEAGPLADYTRDLAGKVSEAADQFEARGFDGVVQDVESFARRRPGVFLLGAGLAGFAVGRLVRGAKSAPSRPVPSQRAIDAPPYRYAAPAVSTGATAEPVVPPAVPVGAPEEGTLP